MLRADLTSRAGSLTDDLSSRQDVMLLTLRRRLGLWAILLLVATATASADRPKLPPLVSPPSTEHHPGKVIWLDLVTPDLPAARRFYGELLGWTFQDVPGARVPYTIAYSSGEAVAGLVQPRAPRGGRHQPFWLPFIAASDAAGVREQAAAHGGRVLSRLHDYPDRGTQAVLADPEGAVFGVLQSTSGDPPDVLADPGQWIWSSLITRDPKAAATFYQGLFGYDVDDMPSNDVTHLLLARDGYARASVNQIPVGSPQATSYWLSFVRVPSTTAAVEKVKALGGSVVTEPHPDRHGGTVAVVADPEGAPFGLLEWVQTAAPGAPGVSRQ